MSKAWAPSREAKNGIYGSSDAPEVEFIFLLRRDNRSHVESECARNAPYFRPWEGAHNAL
jgi:hypothetical protein